MRLEPPYDPTVGRDYIRRDTKLGIRADAFRRLRCGAFVCDIRRSSNGRNESNSVGKAAGSAGTESSTGILGTHLGPTVGGRWCVPRSAS